MALACPHHRSRKATASRPQGSYSRRGGLRSRDLTVPNRARYQAAPHAVETLVGMARIERASSRPPAVCLANRLHPDCGGMGRGARPALPIFESEDALQSTLASTVAAPTVRVSAAGIGPASSCSQGRCLASRLRAGVHFLEYLVFQGSLLARTRPSPKYVHP